MLDPFCGCGTAVHAAQKLGRKWIGIDITHLAISLIEKRLNDAFPSVRYEVRGTPEDLDGARDLARRDKYQFQWWAVSLVDAQPYGGKKKGADRGIDGVIYFRAGRTQTERAVVSVKGGENVGINMVRELRATMERERAPAGILILLNEPTRPMESEAAAAGLFMAGESRFPRLQIVTIRELFHGERPKLPPLDRQATFRKAPRERREPVNEELAV
jgi:adenine specific DNA methylase Mod